MDVAGTDLSGIFESFGNMYNTIIQVEESIKMSINAFTETGRPNWQGTGQ